MGWLSLLLLHALGVGLSSASCSSNYAFYVNRVAATCSVPGALPLNMSRSYLDVDLGRFLVASERVSLVQIPACSETQKRLPVGWQLASCETQRFRLDERGQCKWKPSARHVRDCHVCQPVGRCKRHRRLAGGLLRSLLEKLDRGLERCRNSSVGPVIPAWSGIQWHKQRQRLAYSHCSLGRQAHSRTPLARKHHVADQVITSLPLTPDIMTSFPSHLMQTY